MRESEPARLKPETRATRAHIHAAPISEITRKTGRRSSVRLCDDYTVSVFRHLKSRNCADTTLV